MVPRYGWAEELLHGEEGQNTIRSTASNAGDLLVVHRSNAIDFFARPRVSCLELVLDLYILRVN
jgi:hypothetical protein